MDLPLHLLKCRSVDTVQTKLLLNKMCIRKRVIPMPFRQCCEQSSSSNLAMPVTEPATTRELIPAAIGLMGKLRNFGFASISTEHRIEAFSTPRGLPFQRGKSRAGKMKRARRSPVNNRAAQPSDRGHCVNTFPGHLPRQKERASAEKGPTFTQRACLRGFAR